MRLARTTSVVRTRREDHPKRRARRGQRSEPRIPALGVRTPMRMRDVGGRWSVVLPKRMAVEVMVVKPARAKY
jgi:hypothetical protein